METRGESILFSIADTGIGIDPEILPYIFERFRQGDGSSTRRYGGTGVGLAICRRLARILGGEITVRSEPGKGSTFTLTLPVSAPGAIPAAGPRSNAPEAPVRSPALSRPLPDRPTVLLVEDNPDNRLGIEGILEDAGFRYVMAETGEEAVAIAKADPPDLILMDIQLPGMDGLEATRRIKADPALKEIPIIALTARAMKGDREHILAAGCDGYISKPVDPATVTELIREKLGLTHA